MPKEGKSPPRTRRDSEMDPKKKAAKEKGDSGAGPSKPRTQTSGATSGEVLEPRTERPSRLRTKASGVESPPKKDTPGPSGKSAVKRAVEAVFGSPTPKPPEGGASPTKVHARTAKWAQEQSKTVPVPDLDPANVQGGPRLIYHQPKYHLFDNRGEVEEKFPPEVLEQEGIRTKPPLATVEDLSSPEELPDSPVPAGSFADKATISEPPPATHRSPTAPVKRYPTREGAKKDKHDKPQ